MIASQTHQWVVRWGEWPRQRDQPVFVKRLEVGRSLTGGGGRGGNGAQRSGEGGCEYEKTEEEGMVVREAKRCRA